MDFVMYSIKVRQNGAYLFQSIMSWNAYFRNNGDDFLTKQFNMEMSREEIIEFKLSWLQAYKRKWYFRSLVDNGRQQ